MKSWLCCCHVWTRDNERSLINPAYQGYRFDPQVDISKDIYDNNPRWTFTPRQLHYGQLPTLGQLSQCAQTPTTYIPYKYCRRKYLIDVFKRNARVSSSLFPLPMKILVCSAVTARCGFVFCGCAQEAAPAWFPLQPLEHWRAITPLKLDAASTACCFKRRIQSCDVRKTVGASLNIAFVEVQ